MGCCLSTEYQVDLVIERFAKSYSAFNTLQTSNFPQLVAGRIVPVTNPLFAPVTDRRCVYYSVKAEELVHKTRQVERDGHMHTEHYTEWVYRYTDTKETDFLLVDPANPTIYVYVPFTQCNKKISSEKDGRSVGFKAGQSCGNYMMEMRSRYQFQHQNEWRYTESCFEYGEETAAVGLVKDASVPGGKMLHPMTKDLLNEDYFTKNEWSSWEKSSWESLTKVPSIIITDNAKFLQSRPIQPLPQTYTTPQTFQVPMYIPGYTPPPMGGGYNQVAPAPYGGPPMGGAPMGGYPPQQQMGGGYPPQQGGYPPQQQMGGGYPPQQGGGYPPQQQMGGGYPPQQGGGYPPQQQMGGGYPPQQGGGYPPQQQMGGGYPPQQGGGYPPQQQMGGGYPPQQQMGGGYPQQGGYR